MIHPGDAAFAFLAAHFSGKPCHPNLAKEIHKVRFSNSGLFNGERKLVRPFVSFL